MKRSLLGVATLSAVLLGSMLLAQDRGSRDNPNPRRTNDTRQPVPAPHRLDVDTLIKEYDKNGDGYLDKNEVPPYMREHFDQLDVNHDGKLSHDELEKGGALLHPRRRASDVVFLLIENSDCDDGCAGELQQMYEVLRKLDKNKNGKIDADALKDMRQHLREDRADNIIKELDGNKDGRISREEARGPIRRDFDRLDKNKDGFIDRSELLQAFSDMDRSKKER